MPERDIRTLAVISDSHGSRAAISSFDRQARIVDAIVHLGDGIEDLKYLSRLAGIETFAVKGNCDRGGLIPGDLEETFGGIKFFICHGDQYRVKRDLTTLSMKAQSVGADVALFGHTHELIIYRDGGVLFVNPGALKDGTFAIIRTESGEAQVNLCELY